ncbi:MAG TPA: tripartite tricarboxylate transporter substrate binding protein [Burkholderiales bacterium]|nr:tripartite tricarboxylate transporter substrate binding protein [Burkholderiales bacterium]
MSRRYARGAGIAFALCAACALAQDYPTRPIRLVAAFAPGGSADTLARLLGQYLTEDLGQSVIVDNRPAGGGTVGTDVVAKAQPDGYTLVIGTISTFALAQAMYPRLLYDPLKDFAEIGMCVTFPLTLVTPVSSPITSLRELIEQARARPATITFGSQGVGTSAHVFVELMNHMAKIRTVHVPYKGGGPALNGLLAGEVDFATMAVSTALAQVRAGRLRALAVTSAQPTPRMPGVPAIASVLPGYEALNWHGLHAPARTPKAIVARLNSELVKILHRADVKERLDAMAMDVVTGSPEQYRDYIKAQIALWTPLVKASGARSE